MRRALGSTLLLSLVLGAAGVTARSSAARGDPRAGGANPIVVENSRPGTSGWEIPPTAGTIITGYAAETSVQAGQTFHLLVSAPAGDSYRVMVYRLGWYQGIGGRLISCLPSCDSSRPAVVQPANTTPDPASGLFYAPWQVTDLLRIPRHAVSGYYEAKLEIVSGPDAGAVGGIPLIVRPRAGTRPSAVLIQVPVNTWQAYNTWGGKSLYNYGTSMHATEVSFDRPYDQQEFYNSESALELPWVRFLERTGVDVSYQTDVDTDRNPRSLLRHRLVFAIGHDEYWTQTIRDAFDLAKWFGTNLMLGSNSDLWRMRYADNRQTVVEWRGPGADPNHDTGYFWSFGEPGCQLSALQYQFFSQRHITQPPTPYTVVGPANDPWLSAAGMSPGEVIPGIVGYEWDGLVPGCFRGQVVDLMHADLPGSDGKPTSADMVRATAPSGARVFAMGTMELASALDSFGTQQPNPQVVALVQAALSDLTRPAPPAALRLRRTPTALIVSVRLHTPDPRILRVAVAPVRGGVGCADALHAVCRLPLLRRPTRYAAVAVDRWGASLPLIVKVRPRRRP